MGAVRIYKKPYLSSAGTVFKWNVRTHGCDAEQPLECNFGGFHGGYCNGYTEYRYLLENLNDPYSELGGYISK